jgi:hypothetical protein
MLNTGESMFVGGEIYFFFCRIHLLLVRLLGKEGGRCEVMSRTPFDAIEENELPN